MARHTARSRDRPPVTDPVGGTTHSRRPAAEAARPCKGHSHRLVFQRNVSLQVVRATEVATKGGARDLPGNQRLLRTSAQTAAFSWSL